LLKINNPVKCCKFARLHCLGQIEPVLNSSILKRVTVPGYRRCATDGMQSEQYQSGEFGERGSRA
jgi:hypothetical protein